MDIGIEIATRITVPDGTTVETAPTTGVVIGFRLPCGRVVRPWVTYEIEEEGAGDEMTCRDLGHDELDALGIDDQADVVRAITEI